MRKFDILTRCDGFEGCQIKFNSVGNVIYAANLKHRERYMENGLLGPFTPVIKTYDAYDYSFINTYDTTKLCCIIDFCPDPTDRYLAVVEDDEMTRFEYDTSCKLYEIGRTTKSFTKEKDTKKQTENIDVDNADNDDSDDNDDDRRNDNGDAALIRQELAAKLMKAKLEGEVDDSDNEDETL